MLSSFNPQFHEHHSNLSKSCSAIPLNSDQCHSLSKTANARATHCPVPIVYYSGEDGLLSPSTRQFVLKCSLYILQAVAPPICGLTFTFCSILHVGGLIPDRLSFELSRISPNFECDAKHPISRKSSHSLSRWRWN